MAAIDISPILKFMVEKNGSDLFFSTGAAIHIQIDGVSMPINNQTMTVGMVKEIAYALMNEKQIQEFERDLEMNFAFILPEVKDARFRVNVYRQRGEVSMVIRCIRSKIPSLDALGLPSILKELIMRPRGLILVVGSSGSGKSTTLASMIDYRNENKDGHILTLEDPIEFIHKHKKSILDQREIGIDTHSYEMALKNAMRQAPDVILLGEIRDMDIMKQAMAYSETGHLCLATLHANNANQALERIVSFFPPEARSGLMMGLSLNITAIISQRLIPGTQAKRCPAMEILINIPYVSDLIQKYKLDELREVMGNNEDVGMCTFDQSLYKLFSNGRISEENALANATSRNDLSLKIRFSDQGAHSPFGG